MDGDITNNIPGLPFPLPPPPLIAPLFHPAHLGRFEAVHGDAPHERDVHPQAAVQPRARKADEGAEFGGGPLRRGCGAIDAGFVGGEGLEFVEL